MKRSRNVDNRPSWQTAGVGIGAGGAGGAAASADGAPAAGPERSGALPSAGSGAGSGAEPNKRARRARDFSALISGSGAAREPEGNEPASFAEVDEELRWGATGADLKRAAAAAGGGGDVGDGGDGGDGAAAPPKEKADFGLSGALSKDTRTGNVYNGVVLKWSEPPEARHPPAGWRLYIYKGEEVMQTMHLHRQSAYLVGRERKVADIPVDHLSCSGQHAVLQFRLRERMDATGLEVHREVRPYVLDLESTNGTFLNGEQLDGARYIELHEKDVLKFGASTREYVLMKAKK